MCFSLLSVQNSQEGSLPGAVSSVVVALGDPGMEASLATEPGSQGVVPVCNMYACCLWQGRANA